MTAILIRDETGTGISRAALRFDWKARRQLRVRDLIAERVRLEWDNGSKTEDEKTALVPQGAPCIETVEAAIDHALTGFERRAYLVIINDHQIPNLDDGITLIPDMTITFMRLIPLVGG
ncbi:hypothetical protein [Gluconobacter kanchanaburiensis]|uniref:Uncharacterized protein n=1 Tax=Gluconobacter kanchanaburiensis NBRC 103587 TaxID=1307948 RepID=A0A511B3S8_9PROT|nr:hypothetical protein [Gluconobacter kanchanaburiensis]MBF0860734.1 hypothetical protein [Gluconobacter kanchanaburiensis]GBR69694.1 hypothetical protein AA103587_1468 [Gluconobacter kanchanaburiensis NBRC 103587]GEK95089.1 hypothetical protein GKA01_02860 [Gluconobacter kanchanaburiensis NBRC 103587]